MKKIAVVMPIFQPNINWLKKQLASLEMQNWENLEIWILDDSPQNAVGEHFFSEHLKRIPFHYWVGARNNGTDESFSILVECAQADYIAFCDQDDIWEPQKLTKLVECLERENAKIAYCSLSAIDENGAKIKTDIRAIRRRDIFLSGEGLARELFIKNCIYGCSMLARTEIVKSALPIPKGMHYDHWFSLWAALHGRVGFVDEPLVQHRLHGNNLSAPMRGITTKQDYFEERILSLRIRTQSVLDRLSCESENKQAINLSVYLKEVLDWVQARQDYFERKRGAMKRLWRMRYMSPGVTFFEMIFPIVPEMLFPAMIKFVARVFI